MITIIVVCHFNFVSAFRAPSNLFPQHVAVEFYGKSWSLFFTLRTKFCRSWKNYSFLHSGNQLFADSVVRNSVVGGATVKVHPLKMRMWGTTYLSHGNEFWYIDKVHMHTPHPVILILRVECPTVLVAGLVGFPLAPVVIAPGSAGHPHLAIAISR